MTAINEVRKAKLEFATQILQIAQGVILFGLFSIIGVLWSEIKETRKLLNTHVVEAERRLSTLEALR